MVISIDSIHVFFKLYTYIYIYKYMYICINKQTKLPNNVKLQFQVRCMIFFFFIIRITKFYNNFNWTEYFSPLELISILFFSLYVQRDCRACLWNKQNTWSQLCTVRTASKISSRFTWSPSKNIFTQNTMSSTIITHNCIKSQGVCNIGYSWKIIITFQKYV